MTKSRHALAMVSWRVARFRREAPKEHISRPGLSYHLPVRWMPVARVGKRAPNILASPLSYPLSVNGGVQGLPPGTVSKDGTLFAAHLDGLFQEIPQLASPASVRRLYSLDPFPSHDMHDEAIPVTFLLIASRRRLYIDDTTAEK